MTRDVIISMAREATEHLSDADNVRLQGIVLLALDTGASAERERIKAERMSPLYTHGCPVCGLGSDGNAVWYCCSRGDCPTRVTCTGAK